MAKLKDALKKGIYKEIYLGRTTVVLHYSPWAWATPFISLDTYSAATIFSLSVGILCFYIDIEVSPHRDI